MERDHNLERFIYKRATLDDLEKLGLASHKPASKAKASGGGARDVRFRPWTRFEPVVRRMFPIEVVVRKKPGFRGDLHWRDGATTKSMPVLFRPPIASGVRGDEGWLAESYRIPAFTNDLPASPEPPVFFVFAQDSEGRTWGGWAKEADLRSGAWHADVADPVLATLDKAREHATVRGFVDFVHNPEGEHFGA